MPSDDLPPAEFTPHQVGEKQALEFVRFLAKPGAELATLSICAGGGSLMFAVTKRQLLIAIESAAESIRRMEGNDA